MTGGKHVTPEMCNRIRDLCDRGYMAKVVAHELDLHYKTVYYHNNGECCHPQ